MMCQKVNIRQRFLLIEYFLGTPHWSTPLTVHSRSSTPPTRRLIIAFTFQSTTPFTRSSFTLLGYRSPSIPRIMCSLTRVMMSIHHIPSPLNHPCAPKQEERHTFYRIDCDSIRRSMDESPCERQCGVQGVLTDQRIGCRLDR